MPNHKIIQKKVIRNEDGLYLLCFNEINHEIWIDLHYVTEKLPLYEVIDSKTVEKISLNELMKKIKIEKNKIVLNGVKEIFSEKKKIVEKVEKNKENERKLIGRKALKANGRYYLVSLYNDGNESVKIGLSLADDSNSPMYEQISHKIVAKMKPDQLFSLIEISPSHQITLKTEENQKNQKNENNEMDEIDKNNKTERKLIGRKALKANGRYYLVSLYNEEKESIKIGLSLADDSNSPMYDQISQKIVGKMKPDQLFSLIEISPSHQITLKNLKKSDTDNLKKNP